MTPPPPADGPTTLARQRALCRGIVDYLARNPQAADSADGVARWWLAGNAVGASTRGNVELALNALVRRGLLRSVELADSTVIYSKGSRDAH